MSIRLISLLLVCVLFAQYNQSTYSAIPTRTGREPCYWAGSALVAVQISDIAYDDQKRQYSARITPLVTMAGRLDCSSTGTRSVDLAFGSFASGLDKLPRAPGLAVVVLTRNDSGYYVPGEYTGYMPKGLPVWEIENLADKQVESIASNVRERRVEAEESRIRERMNCDDTPAKEYEELERTRLPKLKVRATIPTVVYTEVTSVTPENDDGSSKLTLRLLGTLAGKLDAALVHKVDLDIFPKQLDGHSLPKLGAKAFVVLTERDGAYQLADDNAFMRSGWSICAVGESDDSNAMCIEILKRLQSRFEKAP